VFKTLVKDTNESPLPKNPGATDQQISAAAAVFAIENDAGIGTAWKVDKNTYVTDLHCLEGSRDQFIVDRQGMKHRLGGDVWVDPIHDLALVTVMPGSDGPGATALSVGKSQSLSKDEPLTFYGFAGGVDSKPGKLAGHATGTISIVDAYNTTVKSDAHLSDLLPELQHLDQRASNSAPGDHMAAALNRTMVKVDAAVDVGDSGGPAIDKDGKVVGNVDWKIGQLKLITPAEDIANLVNHRDQFEHHKGYYETSLKADFKEAKQTPWTSAIASGAVAGSIGAYGTSLWKHESLPKMGVVTKLSVVPAALFAGALLYSDLQNYRHSADSIDRKHYGVASLADTVMVAGLALSTVPKLARGSLIGVAAGIAGRLGADLASKSFVVDLGQHPELDQLTQ
jgi:Trypsin-like peptidase domain